MPRSTTILLILVFVLAVCLSGNGVYAFGAGNIPSFAYMEGRAFRHGDIEDALADLIKKGSGGGFALASMLSSGSKFGGLDIKRVYFGNWLRDYSQAVDIATLKKLQLQTIINLCMALGFLAHGYATNEFEVTPERLGVYLPTEHIDNPKGYGEGEDARKYHPDLRGPVDPRELEVDPQTGMKNYIANENGHWDTSKALVRRTLEKCIHLGRQHRASGRKEDEYEAYRLLGQALHTLEDFSAHSNFCELALVSLGHHDVFVHVGDQVRIQAPGGKRVAPIVTGTFGGNDFMHSLLGEAGDHLSQASVTDLNKELEKARSTSSRSGGGNPSANLRSILSTIPGGSGMSEEMNNIDNIRAGPSQGGKRPEDMSPQELHAVLWQVLSFRDGVVKKINKTIEKIPGLGPLIEKLMDAISVFVFTTLEPFLKPILKTATDGLSTASGEVIDSQDQYEVFNDPRASDPTHSFLSKDHFNLILNEPAGHLATIILIHAVKLVTKAWDDTSVNVRQLTDDITSCLFHPDFPSHSSIQKEMLNFMRDWVSKLPDQRDTLRRLSKEAVRNHENVRKGGEGGASSAEGSFAQTQGVQMQHNISGYLNQIPGVAQATSLLGSGTGNRKETGQAASYYGGNNASSAPTSHSGGGSSYASPSAPTSYPGGGSSYAPPSGPPTSHHGGAPSYPGASSHNQGGYGEAPSFPGGATSSYAPPSGPPPSQGHGHGHGHGHGDAPSFPGGPSQHDGYAPSYSSQAPSFPGSGPSFPGGPGGHGGGGYGPPGNDGPGGYGGGGYGPPSGPPPGGFPAPGGFGMPDPSGPAFPGADPYGQGPGGPGGHGGNHHHGHHDNGAPPFPGGPPPFPQQGNQYPYGGGQNRW